MHQHATLEDTVYFWFGANDTSGSGGDGASAAADVRLAGAAAGAAPVLSPTPTLLSHANYPAGCYEVAVAATAANGFAAGNTYAVFCTLLIDSQNPTGFIGSFTLDPIIANVKEISDDSTAADNLELDYDGTGYAKANSTIGTCTANTDMRGTDSAALAATALTNVTWTDARAGYLDNINGHTAQTGDTYALANGATGFAAIDTVVDAIKVKTDYLPSATAGAAGGVFIAGANAATSITTALTANITGNLSGSVGSVTGAVGSVTGNVGGNVTGSVGSISGVTFPTNFADLSITVTTGLVSLAADQSGVTIGTVTTLTGHTAQTGDNYARLGAPAGASIAADIASATTLLGSGVNAEVLDVLNVDTLIDTKTIVESLQIIAGVVGGKISGAGTGTEVFKGLDGSTTRATVTVDASGNRTAVTY